MDLGVVCQCFRPPSRPAVTGGLVVVVVAVECDGCSHVVDNDARGPLQPLLHLSFHLSPPFLHIIIPF